MKLFGKKKKGNVSFQTAVSDGYSKNLFSYFGTGTAASGCERRLYRSLRENVPVIDAAIYKIIRLIGSFQLHCEDPTVQEEMNDFFRHIRVNSVETGIDSFLSGYMEQLLMYGTAVAEIVPESSGKGIAGLYIASLDDVELSLGKDPFDVQICSVSPCGERIPVHYPELILCGAVMPDPGNVYGTSILRGLPMVSDILMKIIRAIGTNWDRVGNVRFAVSYKPGENEKSFSKERAKQIAGEWSKAMKSPEPKDFVTVGDVNIKVIGADNQIPDCGVPVRQLMEQIVSKLSIPPFMLGLTWSTTERMSSQQADILTSELEYYRRIVETAIRKICLVYQKLRGIREKIDIVCDNINLQDEVELARARLLNAQADNLEKKIRGEINE